MYPIEKNNQDKLEGKFPKKKKKKKKKAIIFSQSLWAKTWVKINI
jgi:hypothetical protein